MLVNELKLLFGNYDRNSQYVLGSKAGRVMVISVVFHIFYLSKSKVSICRMIANQRFFRLTYPMAGCWRTSAVSSPT